MTPGDADHRGHLGGALGEGDRHHLASRHPGILGEEEPIEWLRANRISSERLDEVAN
jgi:hypothetical protein